MGTVVADRYRVLELVARGGMGKIFRAEQIPLGRTVALKVLAPAELRDDEEIQFRKRFEREASICAKLTHSNTVRVFDYGWTPEGIYYIAMEFIDGRTLQQVVKQEAPMEPVRVVHVLRQIAGSLAEAHKQGIVHRDLKPGNVLLCSQGDDRDFVKVVDFGLVKHAGDKDVTQAGLIVGSPMYMSPEQVRGEDIDHRTDIYALGMIAYVALTGKRPFDKDTPIAVLMARMTSKPQTLSAINPQITIPSSLEWAVMTALEMDRRERFASMHELLRALRVCEAEIRTGGPALAHRMTLDHGKTVLPPDFADPSSLRRSPTPVPIQNNDLGPMSGSRTATAAGLSVVAVLLVSLVGVGAALLVALLYIATSALPRSTVVEGTPAAVPVAAVATVAKPDPAATEIVAPPEVADPPAPIEPPGTAAVEAPEPPPAPVKKVVRAAPPAAKVEATVAPNVDPPKVDPKPADPPPNDGWKVESDIKNPFGKTP